MEFKEVKKNMSTIHKLHTARDNDGETIFYKKPYTGKTLKIKSHKPKLNETTKIIHIPTEEEKTFNLKEVEHLTLCEEYGLLIKYKDTMYPYLLEMIDDIIVEV